MLYYKTGGKIKKNKKGFTLIELLAVIVILAIIAVIAVPSILCIIENSRKDSIKASIRSAIKAFETGLATDIYKVNAEYNLNGIGESKVTNLKNNPFKGGTIMYDSYSKKGICKCGKR